MFAYFLLGIELIILYAVFWVVFIREPKPKEIRAELWGFYADTAKEHALKKSPERNSKQKDAEESTTVSLMPSVIVPISMQKESNVLPSRTKSRLYTMARMRRIRRYRQMKHRCFCVCHERSSNQDCCDTQESNNDFGQDLGREIAEKFLLILNRTLNKFSVKIPR